MGTSSAGLKELLTGGLWLVEQVLCRELSPKPWETWMARAAGPGSEPGSEERSGRAWHCWAGRLSPRAAGTQITALPVSGR